MTRSSNHIVRSLIIIAMIVFGIAEASAQLPVRTRELHLISNNNVNYTLVNSADGMLANWTLTLPPDAGTTGSLMLSTVAATTATTDWLDPGNEGESLIITGGVPVWSNQSGLFWSVTGNTGTASWDGAAGNYIGTNDAEDFVMLTNTTYAMKIIGDATAAPGTEGNVIIGELTGIPGVPTATQADEVLNILGGNLRFNSENNAANTREIIFDGTSGTGNFRIGSDGGDITWQGGGGQRLQMSSFWGMEFRGNTGVTAAPAFAGGALANPAVNIIGTRVAAPLLTTTPPAGQTANQQEWRNDAGAPLAVVDSDGDFGIGVTAGLTAKLQIQARAASGNAIQLDPYAAAAGATSEMRYRELAANGANYIGFKAPDDIAADNIYVWPDAYPGVDDWVLTSTALGTMSWQDPLSLIDAWFLAGNPGATAASFLGPTTDNIPLNFATAAAVPGTMNWFIGTVAAGNQRMTLNNTTLQVGSVANNVGVDVVGTLRNSDNAVLAAAASSNVTMLDATTPGNVLINGTAGTPNVRIGSISGAANATIPAGFNKLVITDANGDLQQVGFQDGVETYAWSLTGNAGTAVATNFLGTSDAVEFNIRTNNIEAIRVNTIQQVGIGTAAPSQLLEVEDGNVLISTSAAGTSGELRFEESGVNGNEYVSFNAPAALAANNSYTLPAATGAAGEVLTVAAAPAPTATTATLQWSPVVVTPVVETFTATSDPFAVTQAGTTTYLRMDSDGTPGTRTITLANGTIQGHVMVIRCIAAGANGIRIQDAGNVTSSGNFNLGTGDTMTLIWDGGSWYETARRNN